MSKKIIHIDMDSFYASVEMRDNPALRHIPIAIGGSEKKRGVISTANYLARQYGVHSAMATAHALKLCPELTLVRGDMQKYTAVSKAIRAIFLRYTQIIEPLSLDEAYLDVSDCALFHGSATLIAQDIRKTIEKELHLTASAGVAPIKFIAKIASDINKPNGIFVVKPDAVADFVKALPLGKIPGVGKVTLAKLNTLGLYTGADVQAYDKRLLFKRFGKFGQSLWCRAHGIDDREVETSRMRKSVGVERTLSHDIYTHEQCFALIHTLFEELEVRLKRVSPLGKISRQGIKLKFDDFQQTTVEHKKDKLSLSYYPKLLKEALARQKGRGIRLIGLSVGLETEKMPFEQLSFDFNW